MFHETPTKVLLVEDDEKLSFQIARFLKKHQFEVETTSDGLSAIDMILNDQPMIVVLDLMLPKADGFEVCRAVRNSYKGKILMLTASEDDMDHVAGIETGADDFLVKPVHPRVLLAHIRLLLRRQTQITTTSPAETIAPPPNTESKGSSKVLAFGGLQINTVSRLATLNNEPISLTPSEFDVLVLLARKPEEIVTRDQLLKHLRGIEYDGLDRSIDVKVSALRKKLGDNLAHPKKIITVRAKGYLFVTDCWN